MLIEKQSFHNVKSVGSHRTVADLELVRCEFTGSALSQFDDPAFSLVVRDVTARRCVVKRSVSSGARFEEVLVDGLTTASLQLEGCAFRHVTLRGRIGLLMLVPPNPSMPPDVRAAFERGLRDFYAGVDWALDISEAEFDGADLYYLPGDLVRRDPETQFLLHRPGPDADLSGLPVYADIAIRRFESTPFDTLVAVAPKKSKKFADMLAHYEELRARKLAD